MNDDIKNALRLARDSEPKYDTGPKPGEATLRAYEPTWKERFQNYLMGTDTAKPSPERRRFAEGMTDIVSSAPGISNVLAGERLASAMEAEDLPAAGAAALGMIPGASGYVGRRALNLAKNRLGNRAVEDALRIANRKGYAFGGAPTDIAQPNATTPQPVGQNANQAYISSLYQNILGRQADPSGLQGWTNDLNQGNLTQPEIVRSFAQSPEFQNIYQADPTKAVTGLYQTALGRAPEQAGLQGWVQEAQRGMNLGDMVSGFLNSQEGRNVQDINNAYMNYQGLVATPTQLASAQQALNSGKTMTDVTGSISTDPLATTNFVNTAYKNMTGRAPSPEELTRWSNQINNGLIDQTGLMNQLAGTVEGANWANTQTLNQTINEMLGRAPTPKEMKDPNSFYNDYLSKMAAGTLNYEGLQKALSTDPEAINLKNTDMLNNIFTSLTGKQATVKDQNNYLPRLAEGTLDPVKLFDEIKATPASKEYQLNNLVPKEWGPTTVAEANKSVPQNSEALQEFFGPIEKTLGLTPGVLLASMGVESTYGTNQKRPGSQYEGAFQMGRAERSKFGVANPYNWQQSALGAAKYMAENAKTFTQRTGQKPTLGDFYGMHLQGANGWLKLVRNPGGNAANTVGYQKVVQNLPDAMKPRAGKLTNQEFRDFVEKKLNANLEGPDKQGLDAIKKQTTPTGVSPPAGGSTTTPIGPTPTFDQAKYDAEVSAWQNAYNDWKTRTDVARLQALQNSKGKSDALPWGWPSAPTPPDATKFVIMPPSPPAGGNLGDKLVQQGAGGGLPNTPTPTGTATGPLIKDVGQPAWKVEGGVSVPTFTQPQLDMVAQDLAARGQTALQNYLNTTGSAGLAYVMGFGPPPKDSGGASILPPMGYGTGSGTTSSGPTITGGVTPLPGAPLFNRGGVVGKALQLAAGGGAWTRKEGQNPNGGLNAKGRASAKAEGHNLKPPAPHPKTDKDAARRKSFCSRMQGMKSKLTSSETANDPDSRINKSLRAWNCREEGGALKNALDTALEASHPKRLHHTLAQTGYAEGGEVWDKPRPKGLGKSKKLSSSQKSSAKAAAKAAGRPWPNLVDSMNAAKKAK